MVRRTISVPEAIDRVIRDRAAQDGSYSAAVAQLVEAGRRRLGRTRPSYIGSGDGPSDLGIAAERYLRRATTKRR